MKISNFEHIETLGSTPLDKKFKAVVDVTTGFGPWRKTVKREIMREYIGRWFFVDNGKFAPGYVVDALARSFSARTGIEL